MRLKKTSRKILFIAGITAVVVFTGIYIWQQYKYRIVDTELERALTGKDSLYYLSYDYLHFDEVNGNAELRNVRVVPDTARARRMSTDELPSILLDINVSTLHIKGVKTMRALQGKDIAGDTIVIDRPRITVYVLKPLQKSTELESEAKTIYEEILGKLRSIKVGFVLVDSIQVNAIDFRTHKKVFDFFNGNVQLTDVLIDSAHNQDSSRTLFSKRASFTVDSFYSYNNNRPELVVKKVAFSGALRTLVFEKITLHRFDDAAGEGKILVDASVLKLGGMNTNAIVKDKNLVVDSIRCSEITVYQPPKDHLPEMGKSADEEEFPDTLSGFQNAYSLRVKYLAFDQLDFVPVKKTFDVGKVVFRMHDVSADRISRLHKNPFNYIGEADLQIDYVKIPSKDKQYNFGFDNIRVNSLQKSLAVASVYSRPVLGEAAFANHYKYQRDRFNASMKGVRLQGIEMNDIFDNKLIASQLTVQSASVKIYRDLNKPLEPKSRVGNYPSQMLSELNLPILVRRARLSAMYVEYREKQVTSGEVGTVSFSNTAIDISNITNIPSQISKNRLMNIKFQSRVLGKIPIKGNFEFTLGDKGGNFKANGTVAAFDATELNKISVPMALVRIRSGKINGIDFRFKGDNLKAAGPMVMKYENLKVDILKKDEETDDIRRRGFLSFLANIVLVSDNPQHGHLKEVEPEYERNIYKSFFNLVWKTLFTGMKESVGSPKQ